MWDKNSKQSQTRSSNTSQHPTSFETRPSVACTYNNDRDYSEIESKNNLHVKSQTRLVKSHIEYQDGFLFSYMNQA
jgi:hypothetical protein